MIRFDASKLSVEIVSLKAVTTSLGGSISIIDQTRSSEKKEVCARVPVPMAVARAFIISSRKVTKYLKPVYTAIVRYGDLVIAMERHPLGSFGLLEEEGAFGTKRWEPMSSHNIDHVINPLMTLSNRAWYFDGRYIFSFDQSNLDVTVAQGQFLTSDGSFRKVASMTIDTQCLSDKDKLSPVERSCMAFIASNGTYAISPPIWKNLADVGTTQLSRAAVSETEDDEEDEFDEGIENDAKPAPILNTFDKIDEVLSVNLNFALKAGKEIGKTFGYEAVEPLQLPRLMIELHTVNLPNIKREVKATYDIGMSFTHTMAWLLGLSRKANTLETYIMMRSLMKYLSTKGIFRSNAFKADQVFKEGKSLADVQVVDVKALIATQTATMLSIGAMIDLVRVNQRRDGIQNVGGLLNEE